MIESPQNQQSNIPQTGLQPASGTEVAPAGQKKVTLFSDGTFVESGRMLPWIVLAAVVGVLGWIVMDAWSSTWQEVAANQTLAVPPRHSRVERKLGITESHARPVICPGDIPLGTEFLGWKIYVNTKYGFGFRYPPSGLQPYQANQEMAAVGFYPSGDPELSSDGPIYLIEATPFWSCLSGGGSYFFCLGSRNDKDSAMGEPSLEMVAAILRAEKFPDDQPWITDFASQVKRVRIGGVPGLCAERYGLESRKIYVVNHGYLYEFTSYADNYDKYLNEGQIIFERILSTMKFFKPVSQ